MRAVRHGATLPDTISMIAIVGVVLAIVMPVLFRDRESSRLNSCSSNLRKVAEATLNSEKTTGQLPDLYNGSFLKQAPCTLDEYHYHSWRTMLLPYLDQSSLRSRIHFSFAAVATINRPAINTYVSVFVCPSSSNPTEIVRDIPECNNGLTTNLVGTAARCDYEVVGGLNPSSLPFRWDDLKFGAWGEPLERLDRDLYVRTPPLRYRNAQLSDITDGLSNTLLIAERAGRPDLYKKGKPVLPYSKSPNNLGMDHHQAAWAVSTSFGWLLVSDVKGINQSNNEGLFSFHTAGANAAMADGSIHFLSDSTDQEVLNAIVTRASNEVVSLESIRQ